MTHVNKSSLIGYADDADVVRRRLGDDVIEFHCRNLLQYDHRLHSALSVRVIHHHVALAVLSAGVDKVRMLRPTTGCPKLHRQQRNALQQFVYVYMYEHAPWFFFHLRRRHN